MLVHDFGAVLYRVHKVVQRAVFMLDIFCHAAMCLVLRQSALENTLWLISVLGIPKPRKIAGLNRIQL